MGFGRGGLLLSRIPSLGRLPRSVTPSTVDIGTVSLVRIRDILAQLLNLDDLSSPESLTVVDRNTLLGMGTNLRGRLGGQLRPLNGYVDKDIMNAPLEPPLDCILAQVASLNCLLAHPVPARHMLSPTPP